MGRVLSEALQDEMEAAGLAKATWSVRVVHAETLISRRTAELLRDGIDAASTRLRVTVSCNSRFRSRVVGDRGAATEDVSSMRDALSREANETDVIVVVGHDPSMSWLLHSFLGGTAASSFWFRSERSSPPAPPGVGFRPRRACRSAAAKWSCSDRIRTNFRPAGRSLLTPRLSSLSFKTRFDRRWNRPSNSGAFVTALVAFAVTAILQVSPSGIPDLLAWIGTGMLSLAVIAYFATLFHYDSLLMPISMWSSTAPSGHRARAIGILARPPSSAAWVLFQNMQLIWLRGFTVACAFATLGGVLVALGVSEPSGWRGWLLATVLVIATVVLGATIWRRNRPALGVND